MANFPSAGPRSLEASAGHDSLDRQEAALKACVETRSVIASASPGGEGALRLAVIVAVIMWLICGLAGSAMLAGPGGIHWKAVAKGPITLVRAFNEEPVTYPGPS